MRDPTYTRSTVPIVSAYEIAGDEREPVPAAGRTGFQSTLPVGVTWYRCPPASPASSVKYRLPLIALTAGVPQTVPDTASNHPIPRDVWRPPASWDRPVPSTSPRDIRQ